MENDAVLTVINATNKCLAKCNLRSLFFGDHRQLPQEVQEGGRFKRDWWDMAAPNPIMYAMYVKYLMYVKYVMYVM